MISIKCERCAHDTNLYTLLEASDKLVEESTIIDNYHYESLRRKKREGAIDATYIERGLFFKQSDIDALRTSIENQLKPRKENTSDVR